MYVVLSISVLSCILTRELAILYQWKDLRRQHPYGASEKVDLGWVNISHRSCVVSGAKFTKYIPSNVERIVVDNAVFRLSLSWFVPATFAIKIWSCPKSRRILDGFCAPKSWGLAPKIFTQIIYHSCLPRGRQVK